MTNIHVPDIGGSNLPIIEVYVKEGDLVQKDAPLFTLESDKASMDIPAPATGILKKLLIKLGDKVSEGDVVGELDAINTQMSDVVKPPELNAQPIENINKVQETQKSQEPPAVQTSSSSDANITQSANIPNQENMEINHAHQGKYHASPSVRKFARELGVDIANVKGTALKSRISLEDVQAFIKQTMLNLNAQNSNAIHANSINSGAGLGLQLLAWPEIDFNKFGQTRQEPLSRIKKISGANLHRNWVMIPHVTNHDQADITELEELRIQLNKEYEKQGIKLSVLPFLMKAAAVALKQFPIFNTSLMGENLVYKNYYHIGFAADTPNGLVVPVIRDVNQKGVLAIATEMAELAKLAREGRLKPEQMQGGCFSISSLGGIGGTYFTPIINAPEVAIMGVGKASMQAIYQNDSGVFAPRLMMPLSLSWDHRVIDGAQAARFNAFFAQLLADFRRAIL